MLDELLGFKFTDSMFLLFSSYVKKRGCSRKVNIVKSVICIFSGTLKLAEKPPRYRISMYDV
jgi:hypothetical protein